MITVTLKPFGNSNREAGWSSLRIELSQEKATIAQAFQQAYLANHTTLYDLTAQDTILKNTYAIFLNGLLLWHPVDLTRKLQDGDEMAILDYPFQMAGG